VKKHIRSATKSEPISDVDTLKASTKAQCYEEFEKRWGEPFHKPGGGWGVGTWVLELWAADVANKKTEDEARALYEKLRKRVARIAEEAAAFRQRPAGPSGVGDVPFGAGGLAVNALYVFEQFASKLQPITELETQIASKVPGYEQHRSRTEGRAAFVARMVSEAQRFPLQSNVSNRDVAVASILCGAGPDGWGGYAQQLRAGEVVTPAKVIEEEETRIRKIRNALAVEPSGSGSAP
jgi:hypothetical protein